MPLPLLLLLLAINYAMPRLLLVAITPSLPLRCWLLRYYWLATWLRLPLLAIGCLNWCHAIAINLNWFNKPSLAAWCSLLSLRHYIIITFNSFFRRLLFCHTPYYYIGRHYTLLCDILFIIGWWLLLSLLIMLPTYAILLSSLLKMINIDTIGCPPTLLRIAIVYWLRYWLSVVILRRYAATFIIDGGDGDDYTIAAHYFHLPAMLMLLLSLCHAAITHAYIIAHYVAYVCHYYYAFIHTLIISRHHVHTPPCLLFRFIRVLLPLIRCCCRRCHWLSFAITRGYAIAAAATRFVIIFVTCYHCHISLLWLLRHAAISTIRHIIHYLPHYYYAYCYCRHYYYGFIIFHTKNLHYAIAYCLHYAAVITPLHATHYCRAIVLLFDASAILLLLRHCFEITPLIRLPLLLLILMMAIKILLLLWWSVIIIITSICRWLRYVDDYCCYYVVHYYRHYWLLLLLHWHYAIWALHPRYWIVTIFTILVIFCHY